MSEQGLETPGRALGVRTCPGWSVEVLGWHFQSSRLFPSTQVETGHFPDPLGETTAPGSQGKADLEMVAGLWLNLGDSSWPECSLQD